MKPTRGKPKKWQWATAAGFLLAGLLLLPPFVPAFLREKLPHIFLSVGLILLLATIFQNVYYKNLPIDEQKERDREDRDERATMVHMRSASILMDVETGLMVVLLIVYGVYWDNWEICSLLLWINFFRIFAIEFSRWLVNRKY